MTKNYQGSCLCGQVGFSVTGFSKQAANCHCSMCRKFHGAAFATLVSVSGLTWLSGKALLQDYQADNGTIRTFCCHCGSSIGFRGKGQVIEQLELAIATFDQDIPVIIDANIFTHDKVCWYQLDDSLAMYGAGRY